MSRGPRTAPSPGRSIRRSKWRRATRRWGSIWARCSSRGGDLKKLALSYWSSNLIRQAFMDAYVVKPDLYGVFGSDRLDLGDVVLEFGLRYDYYNSHTLFSRTPGRIFTHPAFTAQYATA